MAIPLWPYSHEEFVGLVKLAREEWNQKPSARDRYLHYANIVVGIIVGVVGVLFGYAKYAESRTQLDVLPVSAGLFYDLGALVDARGAYDLHAHAVFVGDELANDLDDAFDALEPALEKTYVSCPWSLRSQLTNLCILVGRLEEELVRNRSAVEKCRGGPKEETDDCLRTRSPWSRLAEGDRDEALRRIGVAEDAAGIQTAIAAHWIDKSRAYEDFLATIRSAADPRAFHIEAEIDVTNVSVVSNYLKDPALFEFVGNERSPINLTISRDYRDGKVSLRGAVVEGRDHAQVSLRSTETFDDATQAAVIEALEQSSDVNLLVKDLQGKWWSCEATLRGAAEF